ncbi:hypothetical protein [Aquimarina aggregata]|uniref:hypothetical protein n=1 Tax=Aquimarina aggregata TaxID=1642818 RepID=UPI00248F63C8|nr:hypothetical protein [Aquimarina aggregata]
MATTTRIKQNTKKKAKVLANKTANAAKKGVEKTGDFVQSNPKPVIYGVIGVGLLFVGYKLFSGISSGVEDILNPDIDDQINVGNLPTNGSNITGQQARIYADQLLNAMNYRPLRFLRGTDEATILKVFNKLTPIDFKMVFNAFGKKDYNGFDSPQTGVLANLETYKPRDLVYWLNSELGPSDGAVYTKVKQIVNAAGFAF